jgi:Rieske Fe-S protein
VTDTTNQISGGVSRRVAMRGSLVAGAGVPLLAACGDDPEAADDGGSSTSSGDATTGGGSEPSEGDGGGGAEGFASTSDVPEGSGAIFADQGCVVTQPTAGEFKSFTNICTHRGCPVAAVTETIDCNCHGSRYSIEDGSVVTGPATNPLEEVPITVKGDSISLA